MHNLKNFCPVAGFTEQSRNTHRGPYAVDKWGPQAAKLRNSSFRRERFLKDFTRKESDFSLDFSSTGDLMTALYRWSYVLTFK